MALLHGMVTHNHGISTGQRGVTDVAVFFQFHIREHADIDGIFHIDTGADTACHQHLVDAFRGHIHALEQGVNTGVNSALGTDKVINIHLVDGHFPAGLAFCCFCQHVATHAMLITTDTVTLTDKHTLGIDDATTEQFRNNINNTGTANTHAFLTGVAYDGQGRLHGIFINGHSFHCAVGSTHTAGNVAALKSRTCRASAGHQKVPVTEHDLAIGTQVDE